MAEREPAVAKGIFDKKGSAATQEIDVAIPTSDSRPEHQTSDAAPRKEEFKSPFEAQRDEISKREQGQRKPLSKILEGDSLAEKTAGALNNQNNVQADLDELERIDPKDLELAEQLIFNGYAEYDVEMPNLKNVKFTICSTNAEELSIIDEIIYDMVKSAEDKDGQVDMPGNHVQAMKNALFVALSYRGKNKEELMDGMQYYLNTIKKAIARVTDHYNMGEFKQATELKESLKKAIIRRATAVKRLPTPVIDFLSNEKYQFDSRMTRVMTSKELIPKS